jgi:hypothetical protein
MPSVASAPLPTLVLFDVDGTLITSGGGGGPPGGGAGVHRNNGVG